MGTTIRVKPSEGQRRLARYLAETRIQLKAFGERLKDFGPERVGVSGPTVYAWKAGTKSPRKAFAEAIEAATRGAVRVSDWVTDAERLEFDRAARKPEAA